MNNKMNINKILSTKGTDNVLRKCLGRDKYSKNYEFGDRVNTPNGSGIVHEIDGRAIGVLIYGKLIWFDDKDITKGEGNIHKK